MSGAFDVPQRKQPRRVSLLSKLQGDLFHVADGAYAVAVANAHFKKQKTA